MNELLAAAYVAAMLEVQNPSRDAKANAGSYGYSYLSYDALSDYLRPILAKHGLAWTHPVSNDLATSEVRVSTLLIHTSGESHEFGPLTWAMLPKVQDFGGLLSYLKRYSLQSTFGMGAGDDNDAATVNDQTPVTPARRGGRTQKPMTPKVRAWLTDLIEQTGAALDEPRWHASALKILGGMAEGWDGRIETLDHDQAMCLINALKKYKDDGTKKPTPVQRGVADDDPWAAPLVDPATGEVVQL